MEKGGARMFTRNRRLMCSQYVVTVEATYFRTYYIDQDVHVVDMGDVVFNVVDHESVVS